MPTRDDGSKNPLDLARDVGPAPTDEGMPYTRRVAMDPWVGVVRSEVGLVRTRLEDAWCLTPTVTVAGKPCAVAAVFDGVGGQPGGQEAAWAAADHLEETLRKIRDPKHALAHLNNWVRTTEGSTTAVVAILPKSQAEAGMLLSVGDSAAYGVGPDAEARLLVPKDAEPQSGAITDYLGHAGLEGHATTVHVAPGHTLLLCSDGVDKVIHPGHLGAALRAPDLAAAVDDLFDEIRGRGAPDNATVVAMRRIR